MKISSEHLVQVFLKLDVLLCFNQLVRFWELSTKRILTTVTSQGSESGMKKWSCVWKNPDNSNTPNENGKGLETENESLLFLTGALLAENNLSQLRKLSQDHMARIQQTSSELGSVLGKKKKKQYTLTKAKAHITS